MAADRTEAEVKKRETHPPRSGSWIEEMEKRSRRRTRDLVTQAASQGLSENEIGYARISMMARSTNAPCKGRIQMRKPNQLHLFTFGLQRTAGPYRWVKRVDFGMSITCPVSRRRYLGTGRRRCRMHGGADGSGAPRGSKNGNYKHGRYTEEVAATREWLREATHMLRDLRKRPG